MCVSAERNPTDVCLTLGLHLQCIEPARPLQAFVFVTLALGLREERILMDASFLLISLPPSPLFFPIIPLCYTPPGRTPAPAPDLV